MSSVMVRRRLAVLLTSMVLAFMASGCEAQVTRHWTLRDSAGVAILENDEPGYWGPTRGSLSERPTVNITQDESDPDAVWTSLRRTFWWSDGRIGVVVSDPPFLRIFSPSGSESGRVGLKGEGPGELMAATWGGPLGDSAVLRGPRGLSIYDREGQFARQVRIGGELDEIIASTSSGWIVKSREPYEDDHVGPPPPPQVTAEWTVTHVDRTGAVTDTLGRFEQVLTWRVQDALWGSLEHVASDGRRVYAMDSHRFEITVYEGGEVVRVIRASVPTIPGFTEAHLQSVREQWGDIAQRFIDSDREAGRMIVPPAVRMVLDEEGESLWIRRTDDGPRSRLRQWDVFTVDGVWRATVTTPAPFEIRAVRGDRVLGVWTDPLGVTSIRVYGVE